MQQIALCQRIIYPGVLQFVCFNAGNVDMIAKKKDYLYSLDNYIFPSLDQYQNTTKKKCLSQISDTGRSATPSTLMEKKYPLSYGEILLLYFPRFYHLMERVIFWFSINDFKKCRESDVSKNTLICSKRICSSTPSLPSSPPTAHHP